MRRLLAAVALIGFMPAVHAQDKGKSDFSQNAEFRLRDVFMQNEAGSSDSHKDGTSPSHSNAIEQRFKLGLKYKANEKFSMNATLLQSANWGQIAGDTLGDRGTVAAGDTPNFMSVNEAYATWMMYENLNAKFGRMNFAFGDGTIMSVNDWQKQPNSFDGVNVNYELEFGKFSAFAFKYRDLSASNTSPSDGQHDALGLVFDLKPMVDWLKAAEAHVIQDNGDGVLGATAGQNTVAGTQRQNTLRYGLMGGFAFGPVDLKADAEMVGGKYADLDGNGAVVGKERTVDMSMYQLEVGYNLSAFMASRFFVRYHQDSGNSASDNTNGDKTKTYDGYFTDKYAGAGPMQLVGWGNLTYIAAGWSLKPTDKTEAGLNYFTYSKTSADDNATAGTYGGNLFKGLTKSDSGKKNIGNEIDVWAEHHYDGGLSMIAHVGYFMPGDWLKENTATVPNNRTAAITQVMVQGKLTF